MTHPELRLVLGEQTLALLRFDQRDKSEELPIDLTFDIINFVH